ncbi:MAG TPA: Druantia anti-phage system protein DruA [Anaerolineales bacterium]|nr:Druantia anti-phage system protein DruA [Anaerolineales bacterium]
MNVPLLSDSELRTLVESEYIKAGWALSNGVFIPPVPENKQGIRDMHKEQRLERANAELDVFNKHGKKLIHEFANGSEINPNQFEPVLSLVDSGSPENLLFRFATLLWSVPVSKGYGRRMRYIVRDKNNGKIVGIFALMDPVFNLSVRDKEIGWDAEQREEKLYSVMDAYILGAVPPYNQLLAGKMIALAATSREVRRDFKKKYSGQKTNIRQQNKPANLVLVTTTSALGRSSIYNRIHLSGEKELVFRSMGFSEGWGHFHVSESTFNLIRVWLRDRKDPYADAHKYGMGPNWRLRTIRRALNLLGYSGESMKHGIKREVFMAPLASNYKSYLNGTCKTPKYYNRNLRDMAEYFRDRWMIPRSERVSEWKTWTRDDTMRIMAENINQPVNPKELLDDLMQLALLM